MLSSVVRCTSSGWSTLYFQNNLFSAFQLPLLCLAQLDHLVLKQSGRELRGRGTKHYVPAAVGQAPGGAVEGRCGACPRGDGWRTVKVV